MASLSEALLCLQPTSWDTVPQSSEELRKYVRDIFKKSRLVAESVPNPPPYEHDEYYSEEFGTAHSTARVVPSSTRVAESDAQITSMQTQWGKPIKMGGTKENPLGLHVYKLSTGDGKGQWFARRSVHEGLPFTRWRKKLSTEFDETLIVNRMKSENGETPDSTIRGIGAEEKVERVQVKEEDGSELGWVMVYHVSAQFPKPTAPRDFVELIITSDVALQIGGTTQPGRSWMMISKPCVHPNVPEKQGYTRGGYESVELIREIPVKKDIQDSSELSQDHTVKSHDGPVIPNTGAADDDMNPVEWIMVTRSDPGGNIPRWMVHKGTPKSVGTDAAKLVKWAVHENNPQSDGQPGQAESIQGSEGPAKSGELVDQRSSNGNDSASDSDSTDAEFQDAHTGFIPNVTGLINPGLERFAPQAVLDYIPQHQKQHHLPDAIQVQSMVDSSASSNAKEHKLSDLAGSYESDRISLSSPTCEMCIEDIMPDHVAPSEAVQRTRTARRHSTRRS